MPTFYGTLTYGNSTYEGSASSPTTHYGVVARSITFTKSVAGSGGGGPSIGYGSANYGAAVYQGTASSDTPVTPVAPSFDGTIVTVPTTTGITYKDLSTGATLTTGTPITLAAGTSLTVKATPNAGYYFIGSPVDQWTFSKAAVNVLAIPVPPTFNGTTVTVATTTGVTYKDLNTGVTLVTGSPVAIALGGSLTVKATPNTGYYFSAGQIDQWTFTRTPSDVLVIPVAPSFNGTVVTVPTVLGITYRNLSTGATLVTSTPITLAAGTSLTVQATPNTGYYFSGNPVDQWTFSRAAVNILAIPVTPIFDGTTVTVVATSGVTYKILNTGVILTPNIPITLTAGASITIKATPNTGYYFSAGQVDQWTFTRAAIPVPVVNSPTVIWDKAGERIYQTGIDRGVLYLDDGTVIPWNGLISVEDSSTSELKSFYLEGVKYLENLSPGDFVGKLKAFTYPDEFESVNGIVNVGPGLAYHEQPPKSFGLSYRTRIGNDLVGDKYGYKIHILYNILANPDTYGYETQNDSGIQAVEFAWTLTGTPSRVPKVRPTVHISIDSTKTAPELLNIVEYALYGTPTSIPYLPSLQAISEIFGNLASLFIIDHGDGTWAAVDMTATGSYITMLDATTFQINNADATFLDANTYTITSTN